MITLSQKDKGLATNAANPFRFGRRGGIRTRYPLHPMQYDLLFLRFTEIQINLIFPF